MRYVLLFCLSALILASACSGTEMKTSDSSSEATTDQPGTEFHIETKADGSGNSLTTASFEIGDDLNVYAIERNRDGTFVAPVEVSWVLNGSIGNLDIQSGGQQAIFTASTAGSGSIKATYNGSSQTIMITVNAAAATQAELSLSPGTSANMDIAGGSSPGSSVVFTVENTGSASSAALLAPQLSGANVANFEVVDGQDNCTGVSLAASATCTFEVRPLANADGSYSASLSVSDGSVSSSASSLSGTASGFSVPSLSLTPGTSANMDIAAGLSPSSAVTLTLENTGGSSTALLEAPVFSGSNPEHFQIVPGQDNCTGTTLTAGSSCTFQVQAMASSNASYSASLSVSDGNISSGNVSLSGTASGFSTGDTVIFVSSASYLGNLGGLSGADQKCNELADNQDMAQSYSALLSTDSVNAKDRVSVSGIVKMPNGSKVADNNADLWDGSLDTILDRDESGSAVVQNRVWTGSNISGNKAANNCSNWNTSSGVITGSAGQSGNDDTDWLNKSSEQCDEPYPIYCAGPEYGALNLKGQNGTTSGDIDLKLILPGSVSNYNSITIRRIAGANAPSSDCSDASDTSVVTFTTSITAGNVLSHTDATGSASSAFSYRACVYDNGGSLVTSTVIENVLSQ